MKRRDFLQGSVSAALLATFSPPFAGAEARKKTVPSMPGLAAAICILTPRPGYRIWTPESYLHPSAPGALLLVDFESHRAKRIALAASGHKPFQNPHHPTQFVIPPKWERSMSVVDLKKKNPVKVIDANGPEQTFFGHAVFSADGSSYYCSEYNPLKDSGFLVERDAQTHQVIRSFSSQGHLPHDIHLDEKKNLIWVANNSPKPFTTLNSSGISRAPNLSLIDLKDGRLTRQSLFENHSFPAHIFAHEDGSAVIHGSNNASGKMAPMIAKMDSEGKIEIFFPDQALEGEALSVAPDKESLLLSVRDSNVVLRWDQKTKKISQRWEIEGASGILRWPNGDIWITDSAMSRIYIQKENSFEAIHEDLGEQVFGSHFSVVQSV